MTTSLVFSGLLSLLAAAENTPEEPGDAAPVAAAQDAAAPADAEAPVDEGPKYPNWSGAVDIGLLQKQGNTESINGTLASRIVGEFDRGRFTSTTWWLYEDDEGTITERKYGTRGKYDWFWSDKRKNYLFGLGQVGTDFAADVDIRYFLGGGLGYVWRDDEKLRLATDLGVNYLVEEFGDGTDDDRGNYTAGFDLDWTINEKATYDSNFLGQMGMSDSDDVLISWINQIAWDIGGNFRAGFRYVLDWDNTPPAGTKRDDHILALTLGWSFGKSE